MYRPTERLTSDVSSDETRRTRQLSYLPSRRSASSAHLSRAPRTNELWRPNDHGHDVRAPCRGPCPVLPPITWAVRACCRHRSRTPSLTASRHKKLRERRRTSMRYVCQNLVNCTNKCCTANPQQIAVMELDGYR